MGVNISVGEKPEHPERGPAKIIATNRQTGQVAAQDVKTGETKIATPTGTQMKLPGDTGPSQFGAPCGETKLKNGDVLLCSAESQYYVVHRCHLIPVSLQTLDSCGSLPLPKGTIATPEAIAAATGQAAPAAPAPAAPAAPAQERFRGGGCGCPCAGCRFGGTCMRPKCPRCQGYPCHS